MAAAGRYLCAALGGVIAVGAGVAAGELTAVVVAPSSAPVRAVGALLVDHSPAPMREFAIHTFGTHDKTALFIGIGAAMVACAAIIGVVQLRHRVLGVVGIGIFTLVGLGAAVSRPTADGRYAVAPLVTGIVAIGVLVGLAATLRTPPPAADTATRISRRRFLLSGATVIALAATAQYAARRVAQTGGAIAERLRTRLPVAPNPAPAVTESMQVRLDGATRFVTDNADFYRIDTALTVPQLTQREWQLRIHGMVRTELTIGWDELVSMPTMEQIITLSCVSNEVGGDLAGNARWLGYPMTQLLDRVGIDPAADMLLATSVDGWTCGTPLSVITDGRAAMLAIGMNGEPLPLEHGYPVRQVIPGLYGFVSACKWVVDWEITRFDRARAYWTKRGWGERAPIKTASRIDRPAPLSMLAPGRVQVAGTAWAQHRGIEAVQVRVDDGPWQPATLAEQYSVDTWRQWTFDWDAQPGQHTLYCRATDATGATQPQERVDPIPDGATGWHSRVFQVRG